MKILIIGSKGFIGSNAVQYFSRKKNKVIGCDIVNDYVNKNYIQIETTNADYHSVFKSEIYDVCINCSGAASVPSSIKNPLHDFNLNTLNVFKIIEAIKKNQPSCKFINLSSAAVYGNPKKLPISESDEISPVSPYGYHKKMSEEILAEFYKLFSIPSCSLRIFSAYGQGLQKQLLWDISQKAKTEKNIQLYGAGYETRDFIHIEDILQIIELLIYKADFNAEVYNVANGIEVSIKEIALLLLENLNYNGNLFFSNEIREGDPSNWVANIDKIKNLGYKQKMNIHKGLKHYAKWIKDL